MHALAGHRARAEWLDSCLTTLLERDLPALGIRLPAVRLRHLAAMLTHVHGSLLNVSDLARSLGVSVPTAAHDLDVLEGMFLLRRLPPYHTNIQKRLTKSPKVYVRDTGLLHSVAGLDRPEALESWPHRGHSFAASPSPALLAAAAAHRGGAPRSDRDRQPAAVGPAGTGEVLAYCVSQSSW